MCPRNLIVIVKKNPTRQKKKIVPPSLPPSLYLLKNQHLFCHLQPKRFNLGNDYRTDNPEEATQQFLKKNFPKLLECKSAEHDVLFVPDTFIYGRLTEKV